MFYIAEIAVALFQENNLKRSKMNIKLMLVFPSSSAFVPV